MDDSGISGIAGLDRMGYKLTPMSPCIPAENPNTVSPETC